MFVEQFVLSSLVLGEFRNASGSAAQYIGRRLVYIGMIKVPLKTTIETMNFFRKSNGSHAICRDTATRICPQSVHSSYSGLFSILLDRAERLIYCCLRIHVLKKPMLTMQKKKRPWYSGEGSIWVVVQTRVRILPGTKSLPIVDNIFVSCLAA